MYPFYRECELFKPVYDYFCKQGYTVVEEVRIGFCRADLVAFKEKTVTAVELKLADRKRAVVQAKNYQLGADYVYIAFPNKKIPLLLQKSASQLRSEGIGLLGIDEQTCTVEQIITAQSSARKFASITLDELCRRRSKHSRLYKYF